MDFRKTNTAAPRDFFAIEAAGLNWLKDADGARVVGVHSYSDTHIALERLTQASPTRAHAREFGALLAATHDAGADSFGILPPHDPPFRGAYIGSQAMPSRQNQDWGQFFAKDRLWHFAQKAHEVGGLTSAGLARVEKVCERLGDGDFDDGAPPARIHGDLWSGNVCWTPEAVLIDPAAHGGHRITDLAMLALFGAPYLDEIFAAYEAASDQLPSEWRDLVGLHQLHPLLVHAVTHSSAYGAEAAQTAGRYA